MFNTKRIEELEHRIKCLEYELAELRDKTVGPPKRPPEIRVDPRLQGDVNKGLTFRKTR